MANVGFLSWVKKRNTIIWLMAACLFGVLNYLFIRKFGYSRFVVSGYDAFMLGTVSDFFYNLHPTIRHSLLDLLISPLAIIKTILEPIGNFTMQLLALMLCACNATTFVYMFKIGEELIGLKWYDALLISILYYSLGYTMLVAFTPESYPLSMMMLVISLYLFGRSLIKGYNLSVVKRIALFVITAGITTTNGIKILLMDCFGRGNLKRYLPFFIKACLVFCVIAGTVYVGEKVLSKRIEKPVVSSFVEKTTINNNIGFDRHSNHSKKENKSFGFMDFFGFDIPFSQSVTDNLLGETFVLHEDHCLEDPSQTRPLFVEYSSTYDRVLQLAVLLLFAAGIVYGRKSQLLRMALLTITVDIFLHLVLRWALNEVYIMGPHWLYVIPVAIAALFQAKKNVPIRICVIIVTVALIVHNGSLVINYLL